jgi:hypothetical protein
MIIAEMPRAWTFGLHYGIVTWEPITQGGPLMIPAYPMQSEVFGLACERFETIVCRLSCEIAGQMEHGQIEALIFREGTELLRCLMQGYLDLRAIREPRRHDVISPDGAPLTHCRLNSERPLMTIFGEVTIRRKGYSRAGMRSVFPLDGELNLSKDRYSHGLRRRVADEAAVNSFDEAVASIGKTTGGRVPKRPLEEIAVVAAQDFDAFYSGGKADEPRQTSDILVMSVDQKGIVMRKEDLRPATRKAAEQSVRRPGARLNPGEKLNRKRMATVAAVYDIEAHERSPEVIMGLCPDEGKSARPRATNKRVWASVEREPEDVIQDMFQEALRRDPEMKRPWTILVDGGEKQLDLILGFIDRYRPDVSLILDFIHVLEYLWKAAYSFNAVGSVETENWVAERALKILRGEAADVAHGLRQGASLHQLSSDKRKAVDKCADYLEKYGPMLEYDDYLSAGLPIATGVIEGACRHLIKDRMDLTGARWRLKRAEAVLRIRSLRSSGDFAAYWTFHQAREHQRNHCSDNGLARAA